MKRDVVLFNLKTLFFNKSLTLHNYLSYTSRLFNYDKNVTNEYPEYEFLDIDSYLHLEIVRSGNCLYIAVSLNISGVENDNFKLRSLFIIFEYECFFRSFIISNSFNFTFENFILNTAKIGVWDNSLNMIVLSFLT